MSLLVCRACEENRDAINETVLDVIGELGAKATGKNQNLGSLFCRQCGGQQKSFKLYFVQPSQSYTYLADMDKEGNYSILAPVGIMMDEFLNPLNIMTVFKQHLESAKLDNCQVKVGYDQMVCKCGHNEFHE
jgi:hypothetical protein